MIKRKTTTPEPAAEPQARTMELSKLAHREMKRYGNSVNEDRAVSEYHDGCKPVQRRVLWAAYEGGFRAGKSVEKSAKLVGKALGDYHPHGDAACYGAIVNMVNALYPTLEGEGNFGDFFKPDGYAAMRYTNCRLSKFGERVFFDPFYMPVMDKVPNYDSKQREPLYLLALLPNVLFNTTFAIGVGLTARLPRFTLKSIGKALAIILSGKELTPKLAARTLEFVSQHGGTLADGQEDKVIELFKTGTGRLTYQSVYRVEPATKKMVFTGFAPFANFESRAERAVNHAQVSRASNESSTDARDIAYAVYFKANVDSKSLPQAAQSVAKLFEESETYVNNVTVRSLVDSDSDPLVSLRSTTVPELLKRWVDYRVALEVKACKYQIALKDKEIRRIEVMRIAVLNRAAIIKALDKNLDDKQLAEFLAKMLKITVEEAQFILDLRVRQLKALEDKKLVAELKTLKALRAEYQGRAKNPAEYCAKHVQELVKEFT